MPMNEADAERDIDRRSPEDIAASLSKQIVGASLLVGPGQFSPHRGHERVSVLAVDQDKPPSIVWDGFFAADAIAALCVCLRKFAKEVWAGEFDTMYATPWYYAWTCPPEPLQVYDRDGLLLVMKNEVVLVRSSSGWSNMPRKDIARVVGSLSDDWHKREVLLEAESGERLLVAEAEEAMALLDPTYDGIDVMFDASWVGGLGRALANGIGVPYVVTDKALE